MINLKWLTTNIAPPPFKFQHEKNEKDCQFLNIIKVWDIYIYIYIYIYIGVLSFKLRYCYLKSKTFPHCMNKKDFTYKKINILQNVEQPTCYCAITASPKKKIATSQKVFTVVYSTIKYLK